MRWWMLRWVGDKKRGRGKGSGRGVQMGYQKAGSEKQEKGFFS